MVIWVVIVVIVVVVVVVVFCIFVPASGDSHGKFPTNSLRFPAPLSSNGTGSSWQKEKIPARINETRAQGSCAARLLRMRLEVTWTHNHSRSGFSTFAKIERKKENKHRSEALSTPPEGT